MKEIKYGSSLNKREKKLSSDRAFFPFPLCSIEYFFSSFKRRSSCLLSTVLSLLLANTFLFYMMAKRMKERERVLIESEQLVHIWSILWTRLFNPSPGTQESKSESRERNGRFAHSCVMTGEDWKRPKDEPACTSFSLYDRSASKSLGTDQLIVKNKENEGGHMDSLSKSVS